MSQMVMISDLPAEPARDDRVDGLARARGRRVGSSRGYVCPMRDQLLVLSPDPRDWLGDDHLAWFVIGLVSELDTSALHDRVGVCAGRRPYLPEMMVGLLLYSYCLGIRSARVIEAQCRTDVAFRVICGGMVPDHATIARFVVSHERALEGLFVDGLRVLAEAGLVDLSVIALDGTKMAADASIDKNRGREWICRELALGMQVTASDGAGVSDAAGVSTAASRRGAAARKARLEAALERVEEQEREAAAAVEQATREAAAAAEQGRLLRGRKPSDPAAGLARAEIDLQVAARRVETMRAAREAKDAAPAGNRRELKAPARCRIAAAERELKRKQAAVKTAEKAVKDAPPRLPRANVTDPDSRPMCTKDGWVQGYNAQAIADHNQIVVCCEVTQAASDVTLFEPMNAKLTQTLNAAQITTSPELELADAGYWSDANATAPGPDRLIATQKDHKQRKAARLLGNTNGPPDPTAPMIEQMEHLLRTPQGTAAYTQRSPLIETTFANHKHNRGMRSFRRRGLRAANSEWAFIHLAGNTLKLYRHRTTPATATG